MAARCGWRARRTMTDSWDTVRDMSPAVKLRPRANDLIGIATRRDHAAVGRDFAPSLGRQSEFASGAFRGECSAMRGWRARYEEEQIKSRQYDRNGPIKLKWQ